jgi:hypothetical protein
VDLRPNIPKIRPSMATKSEIKNIPITIPPTIFGRVINPTLIITKLIPKSIPSDPALIIPKINEVRENFSERELE